MSNTPQNPTDPAPSDDAPPNATPTDPPADPAGSPATDGGVAETDPGGEGDTVTGEAVANDDDAAGPIAEDADARDRRIAELESQIAELKDHSLRVLADSENLRRRTDREKEQWRRYAAADLAKDLLNAIDNLARAVEAAPAERDDLDEAVKNVIIGVEMTEKQLLEAFEKNHIQRIDPLGEKFDYNLHQAMFEVEDSGQPPGTVVEVLAPGYVLHERLLRAAMVGVAKGGTPDSHQSVDTTA